MAYFREGKQFSPSEGNPTARGDTVVFTNDVFDYSNGTRGEKVAVSGGNGVFIDPSGQVLYYIWTYQFLTGDTLAFAGYNSSAIPCIAGTGKYRGAKGKQAYSTNCTSATDCEYIVTANIDV